MDTVKSISGQPARQHKEQRRYDAYKAFTRASWGIFNRHGAVRMLEPFTRGWLQSRRETAMLGRILESTLESQGDFLAAFEEVRLVAPRSVAGYAEVVANAIGELAAIPVDTGEEGYAARRDDFGAAMRSFIQMARVDLGNSRHPDQPPWWRLYRRTGWEVRYLIHGVPTIKDDPPGAAGKRSESGSRGDVRSVA